MFRRAVARGAAALAAAALVPVFGAPTAHAAQPVITVAYVSGFVMVADTLHHAATIVISGDELITPAPINLQAGSGCTTPTFDGTNFHTLCPSTAGHPVQSWVLTMSDGNDGVWANPFASISVNGGKGDDGFAVGSIGGSVTIDGNEGADTLVLGNAPGTRTANGGAGADTIGGSALPGDRLNGGQGADTFNAKDAQIDSIDCGAGDGARDTVNMDFSPLDTLSNCGNDTRR